MTKQEIIEKLRELYEKIDDLDQLVRNFKETASEMRSIIDNMPDEPTEITDEEKESEDK